MSFFNWFKRFKSTVSKSNSTIDALASLISLHDLEAIVLKSVDKRSLINIAAMHLGIDENKLIDELSEKMGVTSIKRIDAINPSLCGGVYSLSKYKEVGAIPLIRDGVVSGICGVCPIACKDLALSTLPFYLSDWGKIEKALKESEELIESKPVLFKKKNLNSPNENDLNIIKKVLSATIKEADNYSSDKVSILCSKNGIKYQFQTEDGRFAEGVINESVINNLKIIANAISKDENLVKSIINNGTLYLDDNNGEFDYLGEEPFEIIWYRTKNEDENIAEDFLDDEIENKLSDDKVEDNLKINLKNSEDKNSEAILTLKEASKAESNLSLVLKGEKENEKNSCLNPESKAESIEEEAFSPKIKILVLEDNATFARVLQRFLEKDNYEIKHVTNGKEGINILKNYIPDLILSDVHMPEMNGFDFIKEIKTKENFKNIPTIMLTSDSDVETEVEFISNGVDAFVSKSSDPRILGAHVKRVLLMSKAKKNKEKRAA